VLKRILELDHVINSIENEKGCIMSSFEDLMGDLVLNGNHSCRRIYSGVHSVGDALWDIETTICRLEWQKQLYFNGALTASQWFIFSKADIRLFHIELRSLMDHIGLVIKNGSESKNKPKDSFDDLRKKRVDYLQKNMISEEICDLLDGADWFDDFRDIRDEIVHKGASVVSFGIKKGDPVMWAIYKGHFRNVMKISPFVINENGVMNFERYAAYHMSRVYALLNSFGDILYKVIDITRSQRKSAARSHGGIKVLRAWMIELRSHFQSEEDNGDSLLYLSEPVTWKLNRTDIRRSME